MNKTEIKSDWDNVPLKLALNSIREKGYKPADVINKFWERYPCREAVAKAFELFRIADRNKYSLKSTKQELEEYIKDLVHVMMAYYFSHLDVFEDGEVTIDVEKGFPIDPKYQKENYELILISLFGFS